jgi:hypothetical protein
LVSLQGSFVFELEQSTNLSLSLSLSLSQALREFFNVAMKSLVSLLIKRFFSFLKNFLISKKHFKIFCRLPDSLLQAGDMISARHEARSICREFSSEAPIVAG